MAASWSYAAHSSGEGYCRVVHAALLATNTTGMGMHARHSTGCLRTSMSQRCHLLLRGLCRSCCSQWTLSVSLHLVPSPRLLRLRSWRERKELSRQIRFRMLQMRQMMRRQQRTSGEDNRTETPAAAAAAAELPDDVV